MPRPIEDALESAAQAGGHPPLPRAAREAGGWQVNSSILLAVIVAVLILLLLMFGFGAEWGIYLGYRHGQIDALSGHVRYTLTTQPSGEVIWMEKAGGK